MLLCTPGVLGANIVTPISAVSPGAVDGTVTVGGADIWIPPMKFRTVPGPHGHVPEFSTRQTLSNDCAAWISVPSGIVTSVT